MSEHWGGDLIPQRRGTRADLVRVLSEARDLPVEALDQAALQPGAICDPVLQAIEAAAAGVPLEDREANLVFWGIHALAQAREARLFQPLLRLLRLDPDGLEDLLGDAITDTLPRIAASVFDGDGDALECAAADRQVGEYARWSLIQALVFLTAEGRVERQRVAAFLLRFDDERLARSGEAAWAGWEEAIALLGFAELEPRVIAARTEGRLLDDLNGPEWFAETLATARARPDDRSRFDPRSFGYILDAAGELDAMLAASEDEREPLEPVTNPLRQIGRNDPCPCGSGRKYKKCCLERERA